MTGYRPGIYWQWTWRYIGPVIMTCIFVSSIICMAIDKPTYNAYKKEEVRSSTRRSQSKWHFLMFSISNYFNKVSNGANGISKLGDGYRRHYDCCRNSTNSSCLSAPALPNTQSWFGHSSGIDTTKRNDCIHQTNDGRWWCKWNQFYCFEWIKLGKKCWKRKPRVILFRYTDLEWIDKQTISKQSSLITFMLVYWFILIVVVVIIFIGSFPFPSRS